MQIYSVSQYRSFYSKHLKECESNLGTDVVIHLENVEMICVSEMIVQFGPGPHHKIL